MSITKLHKAYKDIIYIDRGHRYFNRSNGRPLMSVTQLIKKYSTPFDKKKWLAIKAEEYGIDEKTLEKHWDYLRVVGTTRGSFIHEYLENRLQRKRTLPEHPAYIEKLPTLKYFEYHGKVTKMLEQADKFIKDYENKYFPIGNEFVVGNDVIAGQIDFLTQVNIVDFKTDKKIEVFNPFQNFKEPLDHLSQCEYNKYCLQISLYRYLLKEKGFELPEDDIIVWFNVNNDNYKIFKVQNLEEEAMTLINLERNDNK